MQPGWMFHPGWGVLFRSMRHVREALLSAVAMAAIYGPLSMVGPEALWSAVGRGQSVALNFNEHF